MDCCVFYDNRSVCSDGDVYLEMFDPQAPVLSIDMQSLMLETKRSFLYHPLTMKQQNQLVLWSIFHHITELNEKIARYRADIKILAAEQVYLEDQNTILSVQLDRKKEELKRKRLELIASQHNADHYRQLLHKLNVSEPSLLQRLEKSNRALSEEIVEERKRVYSLQQELYRLTKEYESAKYSNKSLLSPISPVVYPKPPRKKSLWDRLKGMFKKKPSKRIKRRKEHSASSPIIPLIHREAQHPKRYSTGGVRFSSLDLTRLREDIHWENHASTLRERKDTSASTAALQSTFRTVDERKRDSVASQPAQEKYEMTTPSDPPLSPEVDTRANSMTRAAE